MASFIIIIVLDVIDPFKATSITQSHYATFPTLGLMRVMLSIFIVDPWEDAGDRVGNHC